MKICIVGGIFDKPQEYRQKHAFSPECILADGLRETGVDVATQGHGGFTLSDKYDIVHVHHLGRAAVLAAANKGMRGFIFTGHDGKILGGIERSLARIEAFKFVVRRSNLAIALSSREVEFLSRLIPRDRIRLIRNGIPDSLFTLPISQKLGTPRRIGILYVGQLIPLKGVDILLNALSRTKHRSRITLRLAYQTCSLERSYKSLARFLGIEGNVVFGGFLSSWQLADLYRESDLLVLPSYAEALPSVITEALLSGLPIIASDVGGIGEQVGIHGRLVKPGDVESLKSAIDEMIDELPQWQAGAAERHSYARERFSVEQMIGGHLSGYSEVLSRKGAPHSGSSIRDRMIGGMIRRFPW